MKYDERVAAYVTSRALADDYPDVPGIARSLGTNALGVRAMITCFLGCEPWEMRPFWTDQSIERMKTALAAYRKRRGLMTDASIDPGRPLKSESPPARARKPAKPVPPPDTSEYGIAKVEYLEALARLKAAKARRDAPGGAT